MPDEPHDPTPGPRDATPDSAAPPVTDRADFRVDSRLTLLKVAGAVIFLLLALAFRDDPGRLVFGGLGSLVLAGYATRDLLVPDRLSADREGVTVVAGFAGRRRLRWDEIQGVRVDVRRRLGTRSELLEIDTGETLHLFSGYDLGVPVWRAVTTLSALAPPGLTSLPAPG